MPRSSSSLKPMLSKLPTTSTSSDVSKSIFSSDAAAMLLVPRLCEGRSDDSRVHVARTR